jgi:PKD repeat protein
MSREILEAFARFRRRHARVRAWDLFLDAAFVMALSSAALLLLDRLAFELGLASPRLSSRERILALGAGTFALAALTAVVGALLRPVSPARLARDIDRAADGEERFLSALELAAAGSGGAFAPALCRDALRVADAAPPSRVVPTPPLGHRWAILLALAAGGVLYALPAREYAAPIARLELSHARGPAPLEIGFADASIGAIHAFRWTFGDGAEAEGEELSHVYETPGRYRAKLRVEGPGGSSEAEVEIEVLRPDAPFADFEGEPRKGRGTVAVRFKNLSRNDDRVEWDFGDGATSSERDPVHLYEGTGLYTVKLKVSNELGDDVRVREGYVKVAHPDEPLADFRGLPRDGEAPLEVSFEDLSTGLIDERVWDTGDLLAGEKRILKERNPVYVYHTPGRYTVRLRVKGPKGQDETEKVRYIHVKEPGSGGGGKSKNPIVRQPRSPKDGPPQKPKETKPRDFKDIPYVVRPPDAPGNLVEKVVNVYQPPPPGSPGGPDSKPLESVLPEYRRAAEDSIERERIPPALREHLRRYFDGLRPK